METIFKNNRAWAQKTTEQDPTFFNQLSAQQSPRYLWIGCADSRVPANVVAGLMPGEVFVHRNIANVVVQSDMNCLSVLQYAVEALKVKQIIVCGHYGCGGVQASIEGDIHGLVDNWLRPISEVYKRNVEALKTLPQKEQVDKLCELNVKTQALNVAQTTIVQKAWSQGQELEVHGIIYGLKDGILKDLNVSMANIEDAKAAELRLYQVD